MKRRGHLIPDIASPDNLYFAWYKAKKGKALKPDVIEYEKNPDSNLNLLKRQILTNSIEVGDYHYFTIYDPKVRKICAASFDERILHHALMNICHPVFEKHLIYDTYATRKNKGTYAALDRARFFLKKYRWFAKLDVRKYFDNINHEILMSQLSRMFKDDDLLLMFHKIIKSYQTGKNTGLPIGNLTSQYFANHYLSQADQYASRELQLPAYIRYMDDILLFHNDKRKLGAICEQYQYFLQTKLQLEIKPPVTGNNQKGLPFLGYKLFPHTVKLNKRSKIRFRVKMAEYIENLNSGKWNEAQFQEHILPLLAFIKYADTLNFRKKCNFAIEG